MVELNGLTWNALGGEHETDCESLRPFKVLESDVSMCAVKLEQQALQIVGDRTSLLTFSQSPSPPAFTINRVTQVSVDDCHYPYYGEAEFFGENQHGRVLYMFQF